MAETGGMAESEMLKTFNCGIGMILAVAADKADEIAKMLGEAGETVARIGTVVPGQSVSYSGTLL